jgi:hypothetical protein
MLHVAVAVIATLTVHAASAAELQWRQAGPKHFQPSADSRPIAKFSKPKPRRDGAVRAVAFESDGRAEFDGPSFETQRSGAQQAGGAPLRSVVVDGGNSAAADEFSTVRSAQLQFQSPSEPDNRYNAEITEPFGEPPVEMESTETETTEVELDEEEMMLPPEEMPESDLAPPAETNRQPAANERQPRTFQPAPSQDAPRPDPFVEDDYEPDAGLPDTEDTTLADEGRNSQADCTKELAALKAHTLDQVDLSIAVAGDPGQDFPVECSIDEGVWHTGRCWCETTYMWKASALCHKPLYFEDEALERYGHSWGPCLDPLVSGAHFFCKLPVLPYCMGVTPSNECVYALGHYRPGNCAPYTIDPVPLSCRGAVLEAGAVVGAAAILP